MAAKEDSSKKGEVNEGMGDMSQAAVKKMIAVARERGYITYDELNDVMPPDQVASEQIEDVMSMLSEMGINIIEADEVEDEGPTDVTVVANDAKEVTLAATGKETLDRTDDPVRMYLREMGSVELLSREGEIAIAKRIEAGRKTMIEGLCESPLTFQAITIWRDELLEEEIQELKSAGEEKDKQIDEMQTILEEKDKQLLEGEDKEKEMADLQSEYEAKEEENQRLKQRMHVIDKLENFLRR